MTMAEVEIAKRSNFQGFIFNLCLIAVWIIAMIMTDNKLVIIVLSITTGTYIKDTITLFLTYREWKSLELEHERLRNDIRAINN